MKTAGIVADNYKIKKFKKDLEAKGFVDIEIVPFTLDTSTIKVKFKENQANELKNICTLVELYFKRSN